MTFSHVLNAAKRQNNFWQNSCCVWLYFIWRIKWMPLELVLHASITGFPNSDLPASMPIMVCLLPYAWLPYAWLTHETLTIARAECQSLQDMIDPVFNSRTTWDLMKTTQTQIHIGNSDVKTWILIEKQFHYDEMFLQSHWKHYASLSMLCMWICANNLFSPAGHFMCSYITLTDIAGYYFLHYTLSPIVFLICTPFLLLMAPKCELNKTKVSGWVMAYFEWSAGKCVFPIPYLSTNGCLLGIFCAIKVYSQRPARDALYNNDNHDKAYDY